MTKSMCRSLRFCRFFFQAEDGIRDVAVTGVQTCALPISSRRDFLRVTSGATAGMASWLALGRAPAFAQKRELTFISWNHFVPASDDELRKQADGFSKEAGVTGRVDTIAPPQLPAKYAAEAQTQSGHD